MNLRIQTWGRCKETKVRLECNDANDTIDEVSAYDVLEKGLSDLANLCDVVVDKFTVSRDEYAAANPRES